MPFWYKFVQPMLPTSQCKATRCESNDVNLALEHSIIRFTSCFLTIAFEPSVKKQDSSEYVQFHNSTLTLWPWFQPFKQTNTDSVQIDICSIEFEFTQISSIYHPFPVNYASSVIHPSIIFIILTTLWHIFIAKSIPECSTTCLLPLTNHF
jgi:hypothetical protein